MHLKRKTHPKIFELVESKDQMGWFWNRNEKLERNQNAESEHQIVTIGNNESVEIDGVGKNGAYVVLVEDVDDPDNGTHGTFFLTGNKLRGGAIFRATTIKGKSNEHTTIHWTTGTTPRLAYMSNPDDGKERRYRVKVMTF